METDYLKNVRIEILVGLCALVATFLVSRVVKFLRSNIPPGPMGLPIVGYLPFLTDNVFLKLTQLSKKYGEVFSVRLGSKLVIVLNGTKSIREAFSKSEFLGRPPVSAFVLFSSSETESPFFISDVHVWQEQRRFVVQTMKDLGLGKSKIEQHIQDEIDFFLKVLKESHGQPIDIKEPLTPSMSNNIASLVFGERYDYDDPVRVQFDEALDETARLAGQTSSHVFFPWIKYVPFVMKILGFEKAAKVGQSTELVYRQKIQEHRETLDRKHPRDFIDNYLIEMEERKKKDPNTSFKEGTLVGSTGDLFGAGSETVRTSIAWCMYTVAAYPGVQKKIRKEILEVLGPDRSPEFIDQKNMPYTHAVLLEVSRWQTTVPLNILRYTTADTSVCGFDIPANTIVLANFYAVHHDPNNWKDPEAFDPERFLSPDGKSVQKNSTHLMPFSVGKRACPGEVMANMEMFLYFVSILQKFEVALPEGFEPDFAGELGVTYTPKTFKIRFIPVS